VLPPPPRCSRVSLSQRWRVLPHTPLPAGRDQAAHQEHLHARHLLRHLGGAGPRDCPRLPTRLPEIADEIARDRGRRPSRLPEIALEIARDCRRDCRRDCPRDQAPPSRGVWLGWTSALPRPDLGQASARPRPDLGQTSARPRPDLGQTSAYLRGGGPPLPPPKKEVGAREGAR